MTIKIGKSISYAKEEDEIIKEWVRQVSAKSGFDNLIERQI